MFFFVNRLTKLLSKQFILFHFTMDYIYLHFELDYYKLFTGIGLIVSSKFFLQDESNQIQM